MRTKTALFASSLALAAALLCAAPSRAAATRFDAALGEYETIRAALAGDTLAGVAAAAGRLRATAAGLAASPTPEAAAVPAGKLAEVETLLPEVTRAAAALAEAGDLATARDAFYRLSKPLVRWRHAAARGPAVAFCPMAKRSWLQPAAQPLGNPYYGKQMLRCGEIVG